MNQLHLFAKAEGQFNLYPYTQLTTELIEYYCKMNNDRIFKLLSTNEYLTPHIIEKYIDKWDMNLLMGNKAFTLDLINKYITLDHNLYYLSYNPNLDDNIIEKYLFAWTRYRSDVGIWHKMTTEMIIKYWDEIDLEQVVSSAYFTSDLIVKFIKEELDKYEGGEILTELSNNPNLTMDIVEKYLIEDIEYLANNPCFTMNDIIKYWNRFSDYINVSMNPNLSLDFIDENWDDLYHDFIVNKCTLSIDFIEKHYEEISFRELSLNDNLTYEIIYKYWDEFIDTFILSNKQFKKNINKLFPMIYSKWESYDNEFKNQILVMLSIEELIKYEFDFKNVFQCYSRLVSYYYKIVFDNVLNNILYCPYYKDNNKKYKHHYHVGYGVKMAKERFNNY